MLASHLSGSLCILAGAGISYPPPANLPTALHVLRELFSSLPIPQADRDTLLDALSPGWQGGLGYFDFLRFEQIMEALEYCGDRHAPLLRGIVRDTSPNRYHYQLARLLQAGHLILTTNFDCLIERACRDLGIAHTVLVSNEDYERYQSCPGRVVNPIFKLHGTAHAGNIDAASVAATFQSVTSERTRMASKWAAMDAELATRDLLVIGYSGSDDFDVMPSIRFAPRKLLWVQHGTDDTPVSWLMSQAGVPDDIGIDAKLSWFFCRMFGALRYWGRVKRGRGDVLVVRMQTGHALDELLGQCPAAAEERRELPVSRDAKPSAAPVAAVFAGQESTESLLFAGMLFRYIGLFDRALDYLQRAAADTARAAAAPQVAARVHTAMAQIWMERERWDEAAAHMATVLELRTGVADPDWRDTLDAIEISCRLGIPRASDEDFLVSMRADQRLTLRQVAHIRRAILFREAQRLLDTGMHSDALRVLKQLLADREVPFELQEQADAQWLYMRIRRADNWQQVAAGRRVCAQWDDDDVLWNGLMLHDVRATFEHLQLKAKWADTLLFEAEEHMWGLRPDWSREHAVLAAAIYRKIGHYEGYSRCIALGEHLESIAAGTNGAAYYRPVAASDRHRIADEAALFCPRCRAVTRFQFLHCRQCGWFVESARRFSDAAAGVADRASHLHQLFTRVGRAVLGLE